MITTGNVVFKKKFKYKIVNGQHTTHDDRLRPMAIGHLSDLKI